MEENMSAFEFYQQYHNNFFNKLCHLIGIPFIILSFMTFFKHISLIIKKNPLLSRTDHNLYHLPLNRLIMLGYVIYYTTYSIYLGLIMLFYFELLYFIRNYKDFSYTTALYFFIASWLLQFIGHFIEGKRPALVDSIGQAFLGAPLFSLETILPQIKNYI
jgi:uncharacterized membrane protein YGL010W